MHANDELLKAVADSGCYVLSFGFESIVPEAMKEINKQTGQIKERLIKPEESVWYRYEKMLTCDYKIVSQEHKDFLLKFIQYTDYHNSENESYRRCWTKPIDSYFQHYANVDVLLAPLDISEFNKVKSPLKVAECVFSKTAIIASDYGPYTLDLRNGFQKGGEIDDTANALLVHPNQMGWLQSSYS